MTFPSDFLDSTGSPHQQHGAHQGFDAQQGHGLGANGCVKYVCLHMYVYIRGDFPKWWSPKMDFLITETPIETDDKPRAISMTLETSVEFRFLRWFPDHTWWCSTVTAAMSSEGSCFTLFSVVWDNIWEEILDDLYFLGLLWCKLSEEGAASLHLATSVDDGRRDAFSVCEGSFSSCGKLRRTKQLNNSRFLGFEETNKKIFAQRVHVCSRKKKKEGHFACHKVASIPPRKQHWAPANSNCSCKTKRHEYDGAGHTTCYRKTHPTEMVKPRTAPELPCGMASQACSSWFSVDRFWTLWPSSEHQIQSVSLLAMWHFGTRIEDLKKTAKLSFWWYKMI